MKAVTFLPVAALICCGLLMPWFSKAPASLPKERRQALAMIAAMDEGIGRIRAKLREQGNEKNTLIFFISDNGAPLRAGAWNGSLNLPLVGEKGMLTDGGIRTPFLAAWPGTLPAGKTYVPPVINLDVAASAVALAGLPHDEKLDGVNLMPFLLGEKAGNPHDALFWRWRSQAAIRADHWKLILLGKDERYLFDMDVPEQVILQDIAASAEFWDVALNVPAKGAIIHMRLMLPNGMNDLRRIEITNHDGKPAKQWNFESARRTSNSSPKS